MNTHPKVQIMLNIRITMRFINNQDFVVILISLCLFNRVSVLSKSLHFPKSGNVVRDGPDNKGAILGTGLHIIVRYTMLRW